MTLFCSSQSLTATAWRMTPTVTFSERALRISSLPSRTVLPVTPAPTKLRTVGKTTVSLWLAHREIGLQLDHRVHAGAEIRRELIFADISRPRSLTATGLALDLVLRRLHSCSDFIADALL